MANFSLTTNKQNYFNRTGLFHIALIVIFYMLFDGCFMNYSMDPNAYSKAHYTKFILCLLYAIASQQRPMSAKDDKCIDAAFHFSLLALCISLAIMSFTIINAPLSRYIGIFLIFGGFAGFNLVIELLKIIQLKQKTIYLSIIAIVLKLFVFTIFCLAAFFLLTGEWRWDIKSFEEW